MILLCERCFAPIVGGEAYVSLAHLDKARRDGSITWAHAYLHSEPCGLPAAGHTDPAGRPPAGHTDQRCGRSEPDH